MVASLYIHAPFCRSFCDYCNFYSEPVTPGDPRLSLYVERLLLDAERLFRQFDLEEVPTVYIGGGTPSVLGAEGLARLARGLGALRGCREFTVEANPESADEAFLAACREAGVTRLSLGVQSFCEAARRGVRRGGAAADLPRSLALAAEYFPGAFSVDLISGLPFQDEEALLEDIEKALSFGGGHLSLYALTVEEGTPLGAREREAALPSAEEAENLWIAGRDALEQAGYHQYEVSNFCVPGKESLHNIRYWRMENWLALGPGGSATIVSPQAARRYTLAPDLERWLNRGAEEAPPLTEEAIDPLTLGKETFLMGYRYEEGPDPALFRERFGMEIEDAAPRTIRAWRDAGLHRRDKSALTREGLLLLDRFLREAFGEMDAILRRAD